MRTVLIYTGGFKGPADALETVRVRVEQARVHGAELICLPQLSFLPYFPARRDRGGLEFAERSPSAAYRLVLEAARPAWLAASSYESEGEGLFYVSARLGRSGGEDTTLYRQVHVEAEPGRYEQMFWSPGHTGYAVTELPWGQTGLIVGYDARVPDAYAELTRLGARVVVGGVSEDENTWAKTRRVATGMAASYGVGIVLVNRGGEENGVAYPGGGLVIEPGGKELPPESDGMYELDWGSS